MNAAVCSLTAALRCVEVDAAVLRRDLPGREPGHHRRSGVGPMGRVREQDLGAPVELAAVPEVRPDHEERRELAVGPGRRLERDLREAR